MRMCVFIKFLNCQIPPPPSCSFFVLVRLVKGLLQVHRSRSIFQPADLSWIFESSAMPQCFSH